MIGRARDLRNNATEVERWLWYRLRQLRKYGYHFRRQSPFSGYVLDFVCHDKKVVVELDGSQHAIPANERSDADRDNFLLTLGYRTIRIPNWRVKDDPDWVAGQILQQLRGCDSATSTPTPPRKGEGEERRPRRLNPRKGQKRIRQSTESIANESGDEPASPSPLAGRGRGGGR